jgi:heme a synthase
MGVVFVIGFIYFLIKRYFDKQMITPFIILFVLGALQGAVGWIMVSSGLNPEDTHVSHIRLAIHFIAALILLCYVLWFALQLLIPKEKKIQNNGLHNFTILTISLLTLQLIYGAFMAGMKAAPAAPTWPKINNSWIPAGLSDYRGTTYKGIHLLTDQPIMVHLIHRSLAYAIFIIILIWSYRVIKVAKSQGSSLLQKTAYWPFILTTIQILLGIFTVLNADLMTQNKFGRFEILAELHQLVAMFLLMSLIVNLHIIKRSPVNS